MTAQLTVAPSVTKIRASLAHLLQGIILQFPSWGRRYECLNDFSLALQPTFQFLATHPAYFQRYFLSSILDAFLWFHGGNPLALGLLPYWFKVPCYLAS